MTTTITCKSCNTVFGFRRNPKVYLHHKKTRFVIEGSDYKVMAICRNCSTVNEIPGQENESLESLGINKLN